MNYVRAKGDSQALAQAETGRVERRADSECFDSGARFRGDVLRQRILSKNRYSPSGLHGEK
jgi:hypothetical protein